MHLAATLQHLFSHVQQKKLTVHPLVEQVYGDKDTDGFYRGELRGRMGLIPCNMVSEIRAEDEETLEQLIKQGFLPLSTPVDRIGITDAYLVTQVRSAEKIE